MTLGICHVASVQVLGCYSDMLDDLERGEVPSTSGC